MVKKLKIFSFPDKNPEYLQLQIDSYKKYMDDGNTEFIVINTSNSNVETIKTICETNGVQHILYTGNRNVPFSRYYVEQLNWFRDEFQSKSSDYFMLIHSDMFFINYVDYKKMLTNKKLYFTPQYRDTPIHKIKDGNFNYYYMWDGVLLYDNEFLNNKNLTSNFNWDYIVGISDVGGQTYKLLENIEKTDYGFIEMWNYYHCNNDKVEFILNGNINYSFDVNDKKIMETIQMGNRSFPYENENLDYNNHLVSKIIKLKEKFVDPYNFENPTHIDIIQFLDEPIENSPILHFKSGSGYQDFYNESYSDIKLEQIKKIIFRDEI